jgi:outer membrane protein OmpA-like peptidoglycan-associated protein
MVRRAPVCALCALVMALPGQRAHARDRFNAEAFEPAAAQDGSVLSVYGTRTLPQGAYFAGPMGSYARRPVALRDGQSGDQLGDLVGSIGTLSLLGSVGIMDRFDLGIAVPLHRVAAGSTFNAGAPAAVDAALVNDTQVILGDIRLVPRYTLLQREPDSGFGVAALLPVSLPTGKDEVYGGEGLRVEPRLAADYVVNNVLIAANVGYLVRGKAQVLDSTVDDMLKWGVGSDIPIYGMFSGVVEVTGAVNLLSDDFHSNDAPTEGLLGARMRTDGWLAQLAGGPSLIEGLTAPEYRLLASVGFSAELVKPDKDTDGDGLLDLNDPCPSDPEDHDNFQDQDGCPDLDNDQDSVRDQSDMCAQQPEDMDGFQDQDGCPDPDNDQDTILDTTDRCPQDAEDIDAFQDDDGCPDPDNDQDNVLDKDDRCPLEAGVVEEHGCPAAAPPPPPPEPSSIEITATSIELKETVYFDTSKSTIQDRSLRLMDEIATVLKAHPEILLVVVEGHTDNVGAREFNNKLSQSRAESVRQALIERGVAPERLHATGFGPDKPLVPNTSKENREQNRRVEMRIEKRATAPSSTTP